MKRLSLNLFVLCFLLAVSLAGCSPEESEVQSETFEISVHKTEYAELIDSFYDFAQKHRLTIFWNGSYAVGTATRWFESYDERDIFTMQLEMAHKKFGSIYVVNGPSNNRVLIRIGYGVELKEWHDIVADLKRELREKYGEFYWLKGPQRH